MKNFICSNFYAIIISILGLLSLVSIFLIVLFIDSKELTTAFYFCLIFLFLIIVMTIYKLSQLAKEFKKDEMKVFEQSLFFLERILMSKAYTLDKETLNSIVVELKDVVKKHINNNEKYK